MHALETFFYRFGLIIRLIGTVCILGGLLFYLVLLFTAASRMDTQASAASSRTAPRVTLLAHTCRQLSQWYLQCDGEIRNDGLDSLQNLQAHVSYYTATGTFVTSDSAMVTLTTLYPGHHSAFQIITPWQKTIAQSAITITTWRGDPVTVRDASASPPAKPFTRPAKKGPRT
jgi:hypothetical protein